jgi:hypothetical protein
MTAELEGRTCSAGTDARMLSDCIGDALTDLRQHVGYELFEFHC